MPPCTRCLPAEAPGQAPPSFSHPSFTFDAAAPASAAPPEAAAAPLGPAGGAGSGHDAATLPRLETMLTQVSYFLEKEEEKEKA
jgi:hypothetical protein